MTATFSYIGCSLPLNPIVSWTWKYSSPQPCVTHARAGLQMDMYKNQNLKEA